MSEPRPSEIRAWAEGLSDEALLCRIRPSGHQPVETNVTIEKLEGTRRRMYVQHYRCRNRCGCTWEQWVDMTTGKQYRLQIKYPSGKTYLAKNLGRIIGAKKDVVRLVSFQRRMQSQGESE